MACFFEMAEIVHASRSNGKIEKVIRCMQCPEDEAIAMSWCLFNISFEHPVHDNDSVVRHVGVRVADPRRIPHRPVAFHHAERHGVFFESLEDDLHDNAESQRLAR